MKQARNAGRTKTLIHLAATTCVVLVVGCSGGEVRHTVTGTVTYESKPVERGSISFDPGDPSISPDGATIIDGKYSCEVRPGTHTVRITGSRKRPPTPSDPETIYEDYIPAEHNAASTRSVEVTGPTTIDFDLDAP